MRLITSVACGRTLENLYITFHVFLTCLFQRQSFMSGMHNSFQSQTVWLINRSKNQVSERDFFRESLKNGISNITHRGAWTCSINFALFQLDNYYKDFEK